MNADGISQGAEGTTNIRRKVTARELPGKELTAYR
jgi:hypothetical protein